MALEENVKELFDRESDPTEFVKETAKAIEPEDIMSWDDFFKNTFGEPLENPKEVKILIRRHLPDTHPLNQMGSDLQIPLQFTMDDDEGERWLGILYSSEKEWDFLLLKPDRNALLKYIAGELELGAVYDTALDEMYISKPDIIPDLIKIKPEDVPDAAIPAPGAFYDDKIWIDPTDLLFGMNVEDVYIHQNLAQQGRFY